MIEALGQSSGPVGAAPPKPQTKDDAARQFEEILVRQLVSAMTNSLFKESVAGEDAPQWMAGQAETQREVLNNALAEHLIDSGTIKLSDLMLRQWNALEDPNQLENK